MKKYHRPLRLFILASLLLAGTGCGEVHDYFPTAAGREWTYRVKMENWVGNNTHKHWTVNFTTEKSTDDVILKRRRYDESYGFYRLNATGVAFLGSGNKAGDIPASGSEQLLLKYPLHAGSSWQTRGEVKLLPQLDCGQCNNTEPSQPLNQDVVMHYEIKDTSANVSVPAGVFEQCVHIAGRAEITVDGGHAVGMLNVVVNTQEWYAPQIGLVKSMREERSDNTLVGKGTYLMELEQFTSP